MASGLADSILPIAQVLLTIESVVIMLNLEKHYMEPNFRLLIVDDEAHIRSMIAKALSLLGYYVEEAATGNEALALLEQFSYDLLVLDLRLPGMEGTDVLRRAREMNSELAIIVLTGNGTLESAIMAIKASVADYLLKPIGIHEVIDSITNALQKRAARAQKDYLDNMLGGLIDVIHRPEASSILSHFSKESRSRFVYAHPLRLDRSKQGVKFVEGSSQSVTLSKGETAVLSSLMENAGQILSCQQLIQESWGYKLDQPEAESVIRPYISRLRSKIEMNPKKPSLIRTIRKRGYQFVKSNRSSPSQSA